MSPVGPIKVKMAAPVSVSNRAKVPSLRTSMKTLPSTEYSGVPFRATIYQG